MRLTIRTSGWISGSFICSRCIRSRISSATRIEPYIAGPYPITGSSLASLRRQRTGPYGGQPMRSVMRANIVECLHSSATSVSAYCAKPVVGSAR